MTTNWSLVLNIVSLIVVAFILIRTLKKKREAILPMDKTKPDLNLSESRIDDIIAIRKVDLSTVNPGWINQNSEKAPLLNPKAKAIHQSPPSKTSCMRTDVGQTLVLFLLAKPERLLAGYEVQQSILAADLRFGDGEVFHRHQFENGQGPILFSLAAATPSGKFDMQNMGAFNVKGLCLFMHLSGNTTIDAERLDQMLETASTLTESLDTYLLDDARQPFTLDTKIRYHRRIASNDLEPTQ